MSEHVPTPEPVQEFDQPVAAQTRISVELVPESYERGTHIAKEVRFTVLAGELLVEGGGLRTLLIRTGETYTQPTGITIS